METHPVTIIVGIIGAICMFVLVSLGLSCTAYTLEPNQYNFFKPYYEYAKIKKVC